MMHSASSTWIRGGEALHLCHGPIDIVVECDGEKDACREAYRRIALEFDTVLESLVQELPLLRTVLPLTLSSVHSSAVDYGLQGPVAVRMFEACRHFASDSISPMAAVAGAVADHLLDSAVAIPDIEKLWINNGGDIAVFLGPGKTFDCGFVPDVQSGEPEGVIRLEVPADAAKGRCFGVATSGRACSGSGGRSFSLGIADAVTVTAASAASADAAATMIANRVNPETDLAELNVSDRPTCSVHSGMHEPTNISRVPANQLDPDSDLGSRLVVTSVGTLSRLEIQDALLAGSSYATDLLDSEKIDGAMLALSGERVIVGRRDSDAQKYFGLMHNTVALASATGTRTIEVDQWV